MIYVPDWEKLVDGLARIVAATGASEDTARIALCQAMSDSKIAVQAVVAKGENWAGQSVTGRQLSVPLRLTPAAFDWEKSRPLEPWELGRHPDDIDWGARNIALIEVSTQDIRQLFPSTSHTTEADETATYKAWVAVNEKGNNPPSPDDCLAHMRKTFPDIKRDRVWDLRNTYAPERWRAHGRRPLARDSRTSIIFTRKLLLETLSVREIALRPNECPWLR
jgi:hypothetical protein